MEKGVRMKGDGAWNASTANQAPVSDKEFVINRLAHCIDHCMQAIGRLADNGTVEELSAEKRADGGDAGAILFGGALLAEYYAQRKDS